MKIKDIKIGDWVAFQNPLTPSKNEEIGNIAEINGYTVRCGGFTVHISDTYPIPLTKEILEKNGYELGSLRLPLVDGKFNAEMLQFARKNFVSLMFDKFERNFNYDFENRRLTIRYVHELQHLLWTLGLDDNLKV